MKNHIIKFEYGLLLPRARAAFFCACGFKEGSGKHARMSLAADEVLEKGRAGIRPAAIVSAYDSGVLNGGIASLEGLSFQCAAFSRAAPERVKKLYAFILTVGGVSAGGGDIMEQLYADMWGTAFADAAMELLAEILAEDSGGKIRSFGPGFYGMNMSVIPLLFKILDGSKIGVEARAGSFSMMPEKSCAGFMLAAGDISAFPPADCMNCSRNRGGCALCRSNPDYGRKGQLHKC